MNLPDPVVIQALTAVAALVASITVPTALYLVQRSRESLQYSRAVAEMWMAVDIAVLQNQELLSLSSFLVETKDAKPSMTDLRKAWLGYMVLNTVYMEHLGDRRRLWWWQQRRADGPLRVVLRDDDVYRLSQSDNAYDKKFRKVCKKIRLQWEAASASDATSVTNRQEASEPVLAEASDPTHRRESPPSSTTQPAQDPSGVEQAEGHGSRFDDSSAVETHR